MKKMLVWITLFTLLTLACGVVSTIPAKPEKTVIREKITTFAPTAILRQMMVCRAGMVENNEGLNVRSSAGTDNEKNEIIDRLSDGTVVTLTGEQAYPSIIAWYKLSGSGYVSSKYLCEIQ